jgi:hypothetical protein
MRLLSAIIVLAVISAAGCRKTDDGKIEVTTPTIEIGTKKDTLTSPTVTTQKETLIVNKPVVRPPPE